MTLGLDQKEDLRLRMLELEKKLAESEEERCKLEKTCNILTRAFREEEKMHYKELNKKYEKFLEDCTLRRKRNDIILKSLGRIEDRARALLAKTERLKILKDRYISYLKINDFKKDEPALPLKNFPYSFPSQKSVHDVIPKSVHWKSPNISDVILGRKGKEFIEPEGSSFSKFALRNKNSDKENNEEYFENDFNPRKAPELKELEKDRVKYQNLWQQEFPNDSTSAVGMQENSKIIFDKYKPQKNQTYLGDASSSSENKYYINNNNNDYTGIAHNSNLKKDFECSDFTDRKMTYGRLLKDEPEEKIIDDAEERKKKITLTHQQSIEKLKEALSVKEDDEIESDKKFKNNYETQKIMEKNEIEMNEKNFVEKNKLKTVNEDCNLFAISDTDIGSRKELKSDAIDLQSDELDEHVEDTVPENLPAGLDGVDYQNETYPESYYEQPVHHSHTSIASDVILEEDESEPEADEKLSEKGAKNLLMCSSENDHESYASENNNKETGQPSEPYPEKQLIEPSDKISFPYNETQKFESLGNQFKIDTAGFDGDEQSRKSDSIPNSERNNKRAPQSTLMHLLESDSESFQIEHGDLATGNEDSDFDFSFNQN